MCIQKCWKYSFCLFCNKPSYLLFLIFVEVVEAVLSSLFLIVYKMTMHLVLDSETFGLLLSFSSPLQENASFFRVYATHCLSSSWLGWREGNLKQAHIHTCSGNY